MSAHKVIVLNIRASRDFPDRLFRKERSKFLFIVKTQRMFPTPVQIESSEDDHARYGNGRYETLTRTRSLLAKLLRRVRPNLRFNKVKRILNTMSLETILELGCGKAFISGRRLGEPSIAIFMFWLGSESVTLRRENLLLACLRMPYPPAAVSGNPSVFPPFRDCAPVPTGNEGKGRSSKIYKDSVGDVIGDVAAGVFRASCQDPPFSASQILLVVREVSAIFEQEEDYRRRTGRDLPSAPAFVGKILLTINGHKRLVDLTFHF
ncbi:uncharacterized protein BT62DRAFT_1010251 [Guyanagaster necrorhizus]|uniref:Uncharacterized protein n=1 Tax=Guyanagaster necrorhizus TaxID=856835 RepID=A0A9P7VL51_9AGAR|nr:uncharacterized protein BT62DRAFT_1010251 [Guyanagaster necrorhizus MCA 3950]KAG7442637.1 hypothetical protein BT62DRAFT_1010251 [Guyanagaster necrorhizus MCA 3950]